MDTSHLTPDFEPRLGRLPGVQEAPPTTAPREPSPERLEMRLAPSEHRRRARKLVLCFDGTGNKFRGDDSDSNILKIFRMLDRTADDQCMLYTQALIGDRLEICVYS